MFRQLVLCLHPCLVHVNLHVYCTVAPIEEIDVAAGCPLGNVPRIQLYRGHNEGVEVLCPACPDRNVIQKGRVVTASKGELFNTMYLTSGHLAQPWMCFSSPFSVQDVNSSNVVAMYIMLVLFWMVSMWIPSNVRKGCFPVMFSSV